ncbi:Gti1/Pac2 family-domain-containing protein [Lactarius deliciosus]|nr:Gti1/Pac2 family-domain-containing protein [Lactarius deliciosus]
MAIFKSLRGVLFRLRTREKGIASTLAPHGNIGDSRDCSRTACRMDKELPGNRPLKRDQHGLLFGTSCTILLSTMDSPAGRRPSQATPDVQHFIGYVETTTDALRLIMAARQGIIPRITRRLNDSERRSMIRSGAVFVFCVEESGIRRWTEGLSWSPSRIVGNFLMYREVGERNSNRGADTALLPPGTSTFRVAPPPSTPANSYYHGRSDSSGLRDSGALRPSGLIKKTITVKVSGTDHHLVSYYREEDIGRGLLQRPTSRPDIMRLTIPPEMVRATNFRHPPHVEIGPDGNAHIYDAEEADSSRRQYDRALLPSAPNRVVPSPDHAPSAYPIHQSDTPPTRLPSFPTNNFALGRPLGPHFSQVQHADPARTRAHYSWSPPPYAC